MKRAIKTIPEKEEMNKEDKILILNATKWISQIEKEIGIILESKPIHIDQNALNEKISLYLNLQKFRGIIIAKSKLNEEKLM